MGQTAGQILKSDDVKLEGRFQLDTAQAGLSRPQQAGAVLAAPQARIVENHPEYAVIEITCSCGTRMCLRCEYVNAGAPEASQAESAGVEAPN